ncbi:MAG: CPBP family intramembrane metalloprotease [Bacilli bacterium]|nr:CPBP family intramembrane metalloprotease [Bacilli bacterium]
MKQILKNIVIFIILFILFLYKDLFYLIPLKLLKIDYNSLNYNQETLLSILASCILIIIIVIIYRKYLKEKLIDYKNNFSKYFDLGIKYWFIGICGMAFFNVTISLFSPVHEANNEVLVQEMLEKAPILCFISATFIAAFVEEMLFRKSFGDIFKNKKLMVVASGLFFGLLHVIFSLQTPWDLLYILPYGTLGASFAYTLYKEDNIFIPMTFHMLHNGMLTLFSILIMVIK